MPKLAVIILNLLYIFYNTIDFIIKIWYSNYSKVLDMSNDEK